MACICRQNSLNVRAKSQPFAEQQHATGRTPAFVAPIASTPTTTSATPTTSAFIFTFTCSFSPREVDFGRDHIGTNFINMQLSFNVNFEGRQNQLQQLDR